MAWLGYVWHQSLAGLMGPFHTTICWRGCTALTTSFHDKKRGEISSNSWSWMSSLIVALYRHLLILKVVVSFAMVVFMIRMLRDTVRQRIVTMICCKIVISCIELWLYCSYQMHMNQNGAPILMVQIQWPIPSSVTKLYSSKKLEVQSKEKQLETSRQDQAGQYATLHDAEGNTCNLCLPSMKLLKWTDM